MTLTTEKTKIANVNLKCSESRWPRVKLVTACKKISVGLAISVTPHMSDGGVKLIRNQNIRPNRFDGKSIVYVNNDFASQQKSKKVKAKDVIAVRTGAGIGDACIVPDEFEGALTFTTLIVRPNQNLLDSVYLSQYINSSLGRSEVQRLTVGGGKTNLNSGDLKDFKVSLPPIAEQKRIAEILEVWDGAIAIVEQLITAKQKLKRGFIQRIFVKPHQKNHEFSEFVQLVKEKFDPRSSDTVYPCLELEHIESETGRILGCVDSSEQNSVKNMFRPGDVLFGKLRPYLRKHVRPDAKGVCSTEIWVLRPKPNLCDSRYLFHLVQTDRFISAANKTFGSKMPRADWRVVSECPFALPTIQEQIKIADFLDSLDEEIGLLQSLRGDYSFQKQGLMQKLLTGEWRVPVEAEVAA